MHAAKTVKALPGYLMRSAPSSNVQKAAVWVSKLDPHGSERPACLRRRSKRRQQKLKFPGRYAGKERREKLLLHFVTSSISKMRLRFLRSLKILCTNEIYKKYASFS
jgi:hypothetical protein